jgi:hypothetical protein
MGVCNERLKVKTEGSKHLVYTGSIFKFTHNPTSLVRMFPTLDLT